MEGQAHRNYEVQAIEFNTLEINGKGDQPEWRQAHVLSDFIYPWNEGTPPHMTFQALHDRDWLFGLYQVNDPHPLNLCMEEDRKAAVLKSDRVEIFLRVDEHMNPYYGLEMDPLGRYYDFEGHFYRKFNAGWSWPKDQLIIQGDIHETGYTLEFALNKQYLTQLKLLKNNRLEAGLYRGKCISLIDGVAEFKWISWIRPDSVSPDFHIPSSFGQLILMPPTNHQSPITS